MVIGELSLDGVVRHARGVLRMAATARTSGFKRMFVPEVDAPEAALIPDLEIIPVKTLADLFDHLSGRRLIEPYLPSDDSLEPLFTPADFSEVKRQEHVKRALEVTASGGHNVLMIDRQRDTLAIFCLYRGQSCVQCSFPKASSQWRHALGISSVLRDFHSTR